MSADRSLLDHFPPVHDRHLISSLGDYRELVRNEDHGQAELGLEVLEEVQQLRLDRYVERAQSLVRDQYLGSDGKRSRYGYALPLPAAQLARTFLCDTRW